MLPTSNSTIVPLLGVQSSVIVQVSRYIVSSSNFMDFVEVKFN